MSKPQYHGYWHSGHNYLLTYLTNKEFRERVAFIKANKPAEEIPIRLRWFTRVKGQVPKRLIQTHAAYHKARAAYEKAWAAYAKALIICQPELDTLHAHEHPGCPWDGETLFPKPL